MLAFKTSLLNRSGIYDFEIFQPIVSDKSKTWTTALTTPATFEVYGGSYSHDGENFPSDNLKVNDSNIWANQKGYTKGSNIFKVLVYVLPGGFRKAVKVWFGGARETH